MPEPEASTSTTKTLEKSGSVSIGDCIKLSLRDWNATFA